VLIVQVTPITASRLPTTRREIAARVDQIQFNATLNAELEALKLGKLMGASDKLRRLKIGQICADEEFENLGSESAGNVRLRIFEQASGGRTSSCRPVAQARHPHFPGLTHYNI